MLGSAKQLHVLKLKSINGVFTIPETLSLLNLTQVRTVKRISLDEAIDKRKTLYDVLGVNSRATKTEIKSAYYTLSMTYHPDRNKNDEKAARRFREITEAYEILGSYLKRKRYDQGIGEIELGSIYQSQPGHYTESVEFDVFKKQFRSRAPAPSGRTTAYDYDEWTKTHYAELLKNNREIKSKRAKGSTIMNQGDGSGILLSAILFSILCVGVGGTVLFGRDDYDDPGSVK